MTDRAVVVTGAAGAVGQVVVRRWLAEGARVVGVDRRPPASPPDDPNFIAIAGDFLAAEGARSAIEQAKEAFGPPDTLIHTVGGFAMGPLDAPDAADQWDLMFALNATSNFHAYRAMLPHLRARGGGWLVGIASRAALIPTKHLAAYAASKAALVALTRSLADELRDEGIHVNAILASTIDTPANRAAMGESHADRWVTPDDIADATLYLCSAQARSVHGACLEIYGKS